MTKSRVELTNFDWLNREDHPVKVRESEFPVIENYMYEKLGDKGALSERNGVQRYNSNQVGAVSKKIVSMYEARFSAGAKMLLNNSDTSSSKLFEVATPYTGSITAINTGSADYLSKFQYAMLKNKVYIANRNDGTNRFANYVYDGSGTSAGLQEAGCTPCDNTVITYTAGGGGALSNGYYFYVVTFLYEGYQESGALNWFDKSFGAQYPHVLTALNDAVSIANIPVSGNPRCTGRKIYRSKVLLGGSVTTNPPLMYYLTTIQNNTVTTLIDDKADNALGEGLDPLLMTEVGKPYKSLHILQNKDRIWNANLEENLYTALTTDDITIADSATGGSLTAGSTYTWVFYKSWVDNNAGSPGIRYSKPLYIAHTMGAGKTSVDITYSGSDNWYKVVAYQRSSGYILPAVNPADYKFTTQQAIYGQKVSSFPKNDGVADASRADSTIPSFPTQVSSTYKGYASFSEISMPDYFPAGNVIKIGQDDGDEITNIFSDNDEIIAFKNNSIHSIDTRAGGPEFWRVRPLVTRIGADMHGACQTKYGYVFVKTNQTADTNMYIYEWNGNNEPQKISEPIQTYLGTNVTELRDIKYDEKRNWVWILVSDSTRTSKACGILIYDMNNRDKNGNGLWYIWYNATTDLNIHSLCNTQEYGMLMGTGIGYIYFYDVALEYDKIGATPTDTNITSKWRTKSFYVPGGNVRPRFFQVDLETTAAAGSNKTIALKYKCDDIAEQSKNLTFESGQTWHHLENSDFSGGGVNQMRRGNVYFGLEASDNFKHKIIGVVLDLKVEGTGRSGI